MEIEDLSSAEREAVQLVWLRQYLGAERRRAFDRHVRGQLQKTAAHGRLPVALLPTLREKYRQSQEISQ